jgi:hypothetical protein
MMNEDEAKAFAEAAKKIEQNMALNRRRYTDSLEDKIAAMERKVNRVKLTGVLYGAGTAVLMFLFFHFIVRW